MKANFITLLLLSTTLSSAAYSADSVPSLPSSGKFSLTPKIGTSFVTGGDFVKGASESVSGSATFGGVTVSGTGTFSVQNQKFNDVFSTPFEFGVSANYGLSDRDEISLTPRWFHASGKNFNAATAGFSGNINGVAVAADAPIQGKFSDYTEYGINAGYKHFFDSGSKNFHPYLGAILGITHTDGADLNLSYNGTEIVNNVKFYKSGWNFASGLEAGFRYDVGQSVALGFETGLRYTGDLKTDSTDINGFGNIDNVNHGGNRLEIPVFASLTAKF